MSGPTSLELTKSIALLTKLPMLLLNFKHFYDGETYLQIEGDVSDEEVIIVQNTAPPQEKNLIELMLLSQSLKEHGASQIHAIIPYLCYARADRERISGEVVSHKYTLQLLKSAGIDSLITINVHNPAAYHSFVPSLEKLNLNAFTFLAEQLKLSSPEKEWLIVAPDKGASEDAKTVANILSTEAFWLEKYRDPHTHEVKFKPPSFNTNDKDVLIIDDIITSGGTALKAAEIILSQSPRTVSFLFVHFLAQKQTIDAMYSLGVERVMSSNTIINNSIHQIDIAPLISNLLLEKYL
ncbi:MAG: ribose-phosphate diphosphokinase [Candidatus Heimdallarchaeaceae archaeon]